jgi:hypothetical protein
MAAEAAERKQSRFATRQLSPLCFWQSIQHQTGVRRNSLLNPCSEFSDAMRFNFQLLFAFRTFVVSVSNLL